MSLAAGPASRRCVLSPGGSPERIEWSGARAQVVAQGAAYRVDLSADRPVFEQMDLLGGNADDALWRPEGTLFALRGPGYSLLVLGDEAGGGLVEVARVADRTIWRLAADAHLAYALAAVADAQTATFTHWVALDGGTVTALPTSLSGAGESAPIRSWCRYDNFYRSAHRAGEGDRSACFDADQPGNLWAYLNASAQVCARVGGPDCLRFGLLVRYDVTADTVTVMPEVPSVGSEAGLAADIIADPATGHRQIALTELAAPTRQATFLSADHGDLAWSPDTRQLLYLTRDPVRGYLGFFRLDVSSLRALWKGHTD